MFNSYVELPEGDFDLFWWDDGSVHTNIHTRTETYRQACFFFYGVMGLVAVFPNLLLEVACERNLKSLDSTVMVQIFLMYFILRPKEAYTTDFLKDTDTFACIHTHLHTYDIHVYIHGLSWPQERGLKVFFIGIIFPNFKHEYREYLHWMSQHVGARELQRFFGTRMLCAGKGTHKMNLICLICSNECLISHV